MSNFLIILGTIFGIISIISIVLFIYEIRRAPLLPPDVDF